MATYELWLCDDAGRRMMLLDKAAFFSYSRVINGFGTLQVGTPFKDFKERVSPYFAPDRRIEVWRSPAHGYPMRREGIWFLRQPKVYTRDTDNVQMIEFFGRSPIDLLNRRYVIQAAGTTHTAKTDNIDDMMKAIVREQMLWGSAVDKDGVQNNARAFPRWEFSVQADLGLGPSISRRFADRNVLDILKELRDTSFQLNENNPTSNRKIYFDIVVMDLKGDIYILDENGEIILDEAGDGLVDEGAMENPSPVGFQFQTFADLRGMDRTEQLEFSVENNRMQAPFYSKSHFDEKNSVIVRGQGRGESRLAVVVDDSARVNASRWNRYEELLEATFEVEATELQSVGSAELNKGKPKEELYATFLNLPGGEDVPRSLYGLDWDLGDLVAVQYAEQRFTAEIVVVYVSVDENGVENVIGRNTVEGVE